MDAVPMASGPGDGGGNEDKALQAVAEALGTMFTSVALNFTLQISQQSSDAASFDPDDPYPDI